MSIPAPGVRRSLKLALPALFAVEIHRLMDDEALALHARGQPMRERWPQFTPPLGRLALPSVFIAAERAFARTSDRFDEYKGSVRFPLLLVLRPEDAALPYLGVLRDYRCSIELDLHPLKHPRRPSEWLPSDDALESLRATIIAFLADCGTLLAPRAPSFVRAVPRRALDLRLS